ncbi:MAG TPA: S8 family peptidase [Polyangia bacterium]|nr:S8 family peptidase [Polyangia bacterium]
MTKSRIGLFLVLLGAALTSAWSWFGPATRPTAAKPDPTASDTVETATWASTTEARSLVVDFRDDVTDAELAATPEIEEPISRWSASDRVYRITFATTQEAAAAASRLGANPRVESVGWDVPAAIPPDEASQEVMAPNNGSMQAECGGSNNSELRGSFPSDPCYRYQWHLTQVGLPGAWDLGQGQGVVVAVIDTGVSRVPDLAGTTFVPGYNFVDDNEKADDDHGHGTHVAGTIAQSTNNKLGVGGVAFKASIMPLKVLSARGSGSMAAISQAIRFAADHGAQVINMSLGGPFPVPAIGSAVKYARSKGVTIVAAAGNDGKGRVSYPARYPGVIAVAATQFDGSATFYSNWGAEIDVAAPGGNVRVDQNGDGRPDGVLQNTIGPGDTSRTDYLWFMGTSMASPHAAGVAALIVGAGVTKPDAVEELLMDTARKPPSKKSVAASERVDDHFGAGIIDAGAALKKIRGGRGASELGLSAALALFAVSLLSRRGRGAGKLGVGFPIALVLGSSGLFVLPYLFGGTTTGALGLVSNGVLDGVNAALPRSLQGNALLWSALLPLGLTAILYGVPRLRGALAGFGFGVAGALLFAAIALAFDVRGIPDLLDRAWLLLNAAAAAVIAVAVLRR